MSPEQKIGHYRILCKLGEGGMGEVWRAADTKLNRDVAIKILPNAFANDPSRMARFTREAQVLASLNHPNIAAIYGVEDQALVMELVEGPTLAECISRGPMELEEVLKVMGQLVDALEYAHEKGIVHRDLKPANVKITPDGKVKVLDFGLAKAATPDASAGNPASSPTLTMRSTVVGTLLGTAAYMAPEQARGHAVDKRADIWAFGVVVYEMTTGRRLFDGPTVSDALAAVLTKEPDWERERVPARLLRLLRLCLMKDTRQRLRDIGDARALIEETSGDPRPRTSRAPLWIAGALGLMALALAGLLWRATRPAYAPLTRLDLDLGPDALTGFNLTVAISPDGRRLVYPARGPDGKQLLATRLLDQAQPTLLAGTENGFDPFFPPDGQWIGFSVGTQLKKISVQGGAPETLGNAGTGPLGASWGQDGNIVVGAATLLPLLQIPASGGPSQPVTKLGPGEITQRWPQVLPGGGAVLLTASSSAAAMENANIEAVSLKTGQVKIVQRGGYYGRYLPSGHLVYVHQGVLFGVGFDPARLEVRGVPVPVLENLAANAATGGGQYDFSSTGTFVYAVGKSAAQLWQVAWLDGSGKMQPLLAAPGEYSLPRLSPDGKKLAFVNSGDIYVCELERGTASRLTFTGQATSAVWAPDGKHLVFFSIGSRFGLLWVRSDGSGETQPLLESPNLLVPWSFSPDGRRLAYHEQNPENGFDLWTLPLDITDLDHPKAGKPEPFVRTPANERRPRFSSDGHWIAYDSNESGADEIYVRPFPDGSRGKWQISSGGGLYAFWSNNGRELFYETADNRVVALDYTVEGGSFVPGNRRLWSDKQLFYTGTMNLDLAPDGKRFAVLTLPETPPGEKSTVHVTMLFNFFDELKRRIPAK